MDAIAKEQDRVFQVQQYNQQQQAEANRLAFSAAQGAYDDYLQQLQAAQAKTPTGSAKSKAKATTASNCYTYLAMLTPEKRADVYAGKTPEDRVIRDELIASLGESGYLEAQGKYPGE